MSAHLPAVSDPSVLVPAEQLGAVHGSGLDGFHVGHAAPVNHQEEFARVRAVRNNTGVGSQSDLALAGDREFDCPAN